MEIMFWLGGARVFVISMAIAPLFEGGPFKNMRRRLPSRQEKERRYAVADFSAVLTPSTEDFLDDDTALSFEEVPPVVAVEAVVAPLASASWY